MIVTASKFVFSLIPLVMMNFYWSILFTKVVNTKASENETFLETYSLESASVKTTDVRPADQKAQINQN